MTAKKSKSASYEVGYGRPPAKHQFQKGVSGNPKGRPRGSANLRNRMVRELRKRVPVTRNGKHTTIAKGDLVAIQLVDAAAKGDFKSASYVMQLDDQLAASAAKPGAVEAAELPGKEQLRLILNRMRHLAEEDE